MKADPTRAVLIALLEALKEGEFYDEINKETCYLVTRGSLELAKAKALVETPEIPVVEASSDVSEMLIGIWSTLD